MPPLFVRIFLDSWYNLMSAPWVQIAVMLTAVLCGAIVGGERQRREKPAGLRTLIMVCLGSALFTTTGFAFTSSTGDSGRVAAQIVTGIGFLGAGVILHGRGSISGTTTAATIWVTAAIGMLAATGYVCAALGVSLLIRGTLLAVRKFEVHRYGGMKAVGVEVDFKPEGGKTRARIERMLIGFGGGALAAQWTPQSEEYEHLSLQLHLPHNHFHELLGELADMVEVIRIERTSYSDAGL